MKTIVIEAQPCPKCGQPMPPGALAGLCPACLLAQGLETEDGSSPKGRHFEPPPLEEVAKLFPQLEILALLGAGGMGAVYQARQPALDRMVALKILPAANTGSVNFEERFNREARALARLNHPNIVTVHEFGQAGALHFFIMEFVDGANLRQLEKAGRLSPREALQIIPQICDALQYAHDEGVVHRDIKPENVLVDRKGRVKIADFGLAKILGQEAGSSRLTLEGQVMGTPHYMAPEQVEKPLAVDHRADIYALGVVFYEMLTGDLPLGKFSPPSRKVEVDVRLDDVVLRALENDPARRYQRASEVKTQVENIAASPTPAAEASLKAGPVLRWAGFPLVKIRDGARVVNWPQVAFAFAVFCGVLTLIFGVATLATGRSLWDWFGIVGLPSVLVRLALAAGLTGLGLWRALRSEPEPPPQTPQGTVILPPERFSRKAILGACWAPWVIFLLATMIAIPAAQAATRSGPSWWQIALAVLTLPLAFTAPFGTTILGWLAVSDIRRAHGRLSGLPLAVFDGLLFPLLAFNLFLGLGLQKVFYWFTATQMDRSFQNPPQEVVTFGVILICGLVDFLIVRRVWRAVKLTPTAPRVSRDWWWSRKRGALAIGVACAGLLLATSARKEWKAGFDGRPDQVAEREARTGTLVAELPGGGRMELLAVGDALAPDVFWRPDGAVHSSRLAIASPGQVTTPGLREKDLIFRLQNLPADNFLPSIQTRPSSGYSSGDGVTLDGAPLADARALRFAWAKETTSATLRLGVGLEPWRVIATHTPSSGSSSQTHRAGDPRLMPSFHQAGERDGRTLLTLSLNQEDGRWQTLIVAVDTEGRERQSQSSASTTAGKMTTWTHTFDLPLASVKEFRLSIRRRHWVEFRDVPLNGPSRVAAPPPSPPQPAQVAALDQNSRRLVSKLQPAGTVELLAIADEGAAPNAWWNPMGEAMPDTLFEIVAPEHGQDAARVNRQLVVRMRDLPNGADGPQMEIPNGHGSSGGRRVLRDGRELNGGWLVNASFPAGATRGTVRLGFGLAPWQTVSVHAPDGSVIRRDAVPGLSWVEARVQQVSEAGGEAQLTMLIGYPRREWQMRIVAINAEGRENVSSSSTGSHAHDDPVSVWSYKFWRLPLAQVKEFRVLMRPVEWIEFRDLPLEPRDRATLGQGARPLVPTGWSATKEVHFTEFYDFDKEADGVFPTAADGTQLYRNTYRNPSWAREKGFDVEAGTNELHISQMFICDLPAATWDTISIPEFEKKMNTYYGPPVVPSTKNAKLPLTHGFRTFEGAMGLLQITSFDTNRSGVRLRYKLIKRAHFE